VFNNEAQEPTTGTLLVLSYAIAMLLLFVTKAVYGQHRPEWCYLVFYLLLIGACIHRILNNRKAAEIKDK
jgi:hypothetical protein